MLRMLRKVVTRLIFAFVVLYGLNVVVSSINIFIPINIFTLLIVAALGVPGLISLITIFFIIT